MCLFFNAMTLPLYAVADLDLEENEKGTLAPAPANNSSVKSPPACKTVSDEKSKANANSNYAESESKEYFYSFSLPLPAGNLLPVIPDGEKIIPPEQTPISLPSVVPIVKKSLSWRNHALLMFSSAPDKSMMIRSFPKNSSDLITALINQSSEANYQICTEYISAGHMLIEVPEQISESKKQISFVVSFRMKDDSNCELGLKVLPPVSKYSLNLAQNFLAKVEQRLKYSPENTF